MSDEQALVALVASIDERPTLGQIDEMLGLLSRMPHCVANDTLADTLLEMRPGVASLESAAA